MAAALDDGSGGHNGQAGFFLQFGDGERTAVAHGRAHFVQRRLYTVSQGTGQDFANLTLIVYHIPVAAQFVIKGPGG